MTSQRLGHLGKELEQFGFEIDSKRTGYVEAKDHPEVPFTGWVLEAIKAGDIQKDAELSQNFFTRVARPHSDSDEEVEIEESDRTSVHKEFVLTPLSNLLPAELEKDNTRIDTTGMSEQEIQGFLNDEREKGWRLDREIWTDKHGTHERAVLIRDEVE